MKSVKHILVAITAVTFLFLFSPASQLQAQGMPAYDSLTPITTNLITPTAVALDSSGNLYVTESSQDRLNIYSQSGAHKGTITGLGIPVSVAVDGNGKIYIGNSEDGNVSVYDPDLTFLSKLGAGDGEIKNPTDIAIDSSGMIYVVDYDANIVKMYNSDGSYNGELGAASDGTLPTPDGQFNKPSSIEINEAAGEIIVLDRQELFDNSLTREGLIAGAIDGARIQKFHMNGSHKSSFSHFGTASDIGQMFRPQHIAVDSEGRMYVTDSYYNIVFVYGDDGDLGNGYLDEYLGFITNTEDTMRITAGITIGSDNILYVAGLMSHVVHVFGTDAYTLMEVSPLSLSFEGREGDADPALQSVTITNNAASVLNWTAVANESWITVSAAAGSAGASDSSVLDVGIDLTGLTVGTYTGSVAISAESGATEIVDVELIVTEIQLSADPGGPYTEVEGNSVLLDGSGSTGNIVSYEWDINNDGSFEYISSSPTQSHLFGSVGFHYVNLRVTDDLGFTNEAVAQIEIIDSMPTADFTGSPTNGEAPHVVNFINSSTGYDQPLTYAWDFDNDGTTDSTEENPTFIYNDADTYTVKLTVTDSDGSVNALVKTDYITATSGACTTQPVEMGGVYYSTLQAAYDAAMDGATIRSHAVTFTEGLSINRDIAVTFIGGYSCDYDVITGNTSVPGLVWATNGVTTIEYMIIY